MDKRGEEFYQITLGGRAGEEATVGEITGPSLAADAVPPAVLRVLRTYLALRNPGESFARALQRLGHDPFKEALYDRSAAWAGGRACAGAAHSAPGAGETLWSTLDAETLAAPALEIAFQSFQGWTGLHPRPGAAGSAWLPRAGSVPAVACFPIKRPT